MNMRKFESLLAALEGACRAISEEVHVIGIRYSGDPSYGAEANLSIHVTHDVFETGCLPVERLQYRPGREYPWCMECKVDDITIFAICSNDDIYKIPIDNDTAISSETARYLRFLMTEKEHEAKEVKSHGVAGGR